MKPRTTATLLSALVLASVGAAPQAVAATCQYNRQDLPVPAGSGHVSTMGSSTNNSRIAGLVMKGQFGRGAYWINSALREMPPSPLSASYHVIPSGINNTSVVAGYEQRDGERTKKAFRYENGAYQYLETDPGQSSTAYAINDTGDVIGLQFYGISEYYGDVYLWPRTGPRKLVSSGKPIGITADRKVVVQRVVTTDVIDTDTGSVVEIPGRAAWVVLDNDRVLVSEYADQVGWEMREYDLAGTKVATHSGGAKPFGRNGSGTVFGGYPGRTGANLPALWRKTGRTDVVADFLPSDSSYSDVTDAATLIGTYSGADSVARPARWLWICS